MIQFNLLPDVKLQYIKARRQKRTVMMTSVLVAGASLTIFVLLFMVVNVAQKEHLAHLQKDIDHSKSELSAKPELAKILTIQNQLNSLPDLHKQKPVATRVFGYVQQLTPQNVSISSFKVNFGDQTIQIEGSADSLATVNTFVDTLKFTSYSEGESKGNWTMNQEYKASEAVSYLGTTYIATADHTASTDTEPGVGGQWKDKWEQAPMAFSEVVLANFAVSSQNVKDKSKVASYSITLKYDPVIFSSDKAAKLQVAHKVTTRSETEKPSAVFQTKPAETNTGGTN